jgi:hypothetical protein
LRWLYYQDNSSKICTTLKRILATQYIPALLAIVLPLRSQEQSRSREICALHDKSCAAQ